MGGLGKRERSYLEGIQLDIGVPMSQALDHAVNGLLGPVGVGSYSIADLHDGTPVFGREVLVGRLVYCRLGARCQKTPV